MKSPISKYYICYFMLILLFISSQTLVYAIEKESFSNDPNFEKVKYTVSYEKYKYILNSDGSLDYEFETMLDLKQFNFGENVYLSSQFNKNSTIFDASIYDNNNITFKEVLKIDKNSRCNNEYYINFNKNEIICCFKKTDDGKKILIKIKFESQNNYNICDSNDIIGYDISYNLNQTINIQQQREIKIILLGGLNVKLEEFNYFPIMNESITKYSENNLDGSLISFNTPKFSLLDLNINLVGTDKEFLINKKNIESQIYDLILISFILGIIMVVLIVRLHVADKFDKFLKVLVSLAIAVIPSLFLHIIVSPNYFSNLVYFSSFFVFSPHIILILSFIISYIIITSSKNKLVLVISNIKNSLKNLKTNSHKY